MEEGVPPEHPRASTTDDVECFFSILRDFVGKHFTVEQVQFEFRKLSIEFMKRMDPDFSFYYYTAAHNLFRKDLFLVSTNQGLGKSPHEIDDTCEFLIVISWEVLWQVVQPW